ncbi:unnamed protein product [Cyprideis torosa]|uniref:Uncharacterized protein n=1 Tax=Cyprideis torosa TaxID=163714 RepID=A0A7R8WUV9_9CRUS|nr:unnamed protein product [Cyprideis torosa]CAG0910571.1 unnamed protein product [Cyprideis torosa]
MIVSFGSKQTEKIWNGERVKKLPLDIQNVGRRKLRMLNNSVDIADLRIPPSNRLERLGGNLKEFYSIRINKQWRIIFKWNIGNAKPLEITAYRLSKDLHIPQTRISEIVKGNRRITADTALRLSKYFGNSAKFWLGLQDDFDIEEEKNSKQNDLEQIELFKNKNVA